jgi:hypothetical protein
MRELHRRNSRHATTFCLALLVVLSACHPPMPKVAVEGDPGAIDALAGQWEGSYESEKNGREGTIQFSLAAAGDTARGEVLMMPAWSSEPYQGSARGEPRERRPVREPTVLTIRFVRAQQGQVLGTLDPYIDPDCDCRVTTNFIGSVDGDEARGVFAIRGMKSWLAYGEWRARRVRTATP